MTGTTINDLLDLLEISDNILRYNFNIEETIRNNKGKVVYSYNDIIIASEISEELYSELLKNPYINHIESVPLKQYGDIDLSLIGQIDTSNIINVDEINYDIDTEYEVEYGNSTDITDGYAPIITNINFYISSFTNEWFNYQVEVSGSTPIKYEFLLPDTYSGLMDFKNINLLSGISYNYGIFNILLRVSNKYGVDIKTLTLTVNESLKITNTDLLIYNRIGSNLTYLITSSGQEPKYYSVDYLPSGLILDNNLIFGKILTGGTYDINITVSGSTENDTKKLTINVGESPIITSPTRIECEVNSNFIYNIITNLTDNITYSIMGKLPIGLSFKVDSIIGIPTETGIFSIDMKVSNPYGYNIKKLEILIYNMGT